VVEEFKGNQMSQLHKITEKIGLMISWNRVHEVDSIIKSELGKMAESMVWFVPNALNDDARLKQYQEKLGLSQGEVSLAGLHIEEKPVEKCEHQPSLVPNSIYNKCIKCGELFEFHVESNREWCQHLVEMFSGIPGSPDPSWKFCPVCSKPRPEEPKSEVELLAKKLYEEYWSNKLPFVGTTTPTEKRDWIRVAQVALEFRK